MTESKPSRGIQGALVKLWRGGDYELTVTGRTEITPNYLRLHFTTGTLLAERPVHPTMWVRGWFPDGPKVHQRGYTLANPDPARGTVDIDFAMHDGIATRWASHAAPGDTRLRRIGSLCLGGVRHPHHPSRRQDPARGILGAAQPDQGPGLLGGLTPSARIKRRAATGSRCRTRRA